MARHEAGDSEARYAHEIAGVVGPIPSALSTQDWQGIQYKVLTEDGTIVTRIKRDKTSAD